MAEKNSSELGTVKISSEVIAAYIFDAVLGTPGVTSFSGGFSDNLMGSLLGKDSRYKGIKMTDDENGYVFDIYIIVDFGSRIPEVAWSIQKNIKTELEGVMEIEIKNVNIHVQGVQKKNDSLPDTVISAIDADTGGSADA